MTKKNADPFPDFSKYVLPDSIPRPRAMDADGELRVDRDAPITNTTRLYSEMPQLAIIGGLDSSRQGRHPTAFIEQDEANGARQMSEQTQQLPAEGSDDPTWAKMGVHFGQPVAGDPIFRSVTLPPGWKIARTEHNMWTELLDEKGRKRASIFYKAAFYDRSAFIRAERRFNVASTYPDSGPRVMRVVDGHHETGKVIHESQPFEERDYAQAEIARKEMAAWLLEKYPDAQNPAAYWELP